MEVQNVAHTILPRFEVKFAPSCNTQSNRPFAGSGHMVHNKLHWDANNAVGLPKQRKSYQSSPTFVCFESPTALFASQCNLFRTRWPDPAKGLLCSTTLNLDLEKSHIFLRVSVDLRRLLNWFHSCSWDEAIFSQGRCFTVCLSMLQSFTLSSQIQFKMCYRCKIHCIDKICLVLASFE